MRTVAEIAEELHISRQAVMGWLKKPEMQPHISKKGKALHISDAGFAIISDKRNRSKSNQEDNRTVDVDKSLHFKLLEERVSDLQSYLKSREIEMQRLTDELSNKSKEVADLHRMLENQQILTLNAQAEVKRLSEPQEAVQKNNQPRPEPGFWQRIFGGGRT